ncbi:MIT domain-containing protein [Apiospora phragmitis]|uniref:MIT domain-containing protein n=1 Tax=Apiospora phragmitis TaxID=2905665 RepID=A0ABR1TNF5_9PEZI
MASESIYPPTSDGTIPPDRAQHVRRLAILGCDADGVDRNTVALYAEEALKNLVQLGTAELHILTEQVPIARGMTSLLRLEALRSRMRRFFHDETAAEFLRPVQHLKHAWLEVDAVIPIERFRNQEHHLLRLLETTGTISSAANKQILHTLKVERERGITVKARTGSMIYNLTSSMPLGTSTSAPRRPGLPPAVAAPCCSSTPARTSSPDSRQLLRAFVEGLKILPVIDMSAADVLRILDQLEGDHMKPLRMLLVDLWYDKFRGVICLVRLFDGTVRAGDNLVIGPAGRAGWLYLPPGVKTTQNAKIDHAFTTVGSEDIAAPYPGFEEPKPMVFAAVFPTDSSDYHRLAGLAGLAEHIGQLVLGDRSVIRPKEHSEHGASIAITDPAVSDEGGLGGRYPTSHADLAEFPDEYHRTWGTVFYKPYVLATVTVPEEYLGSPSRYIDAIRAE